MQPKVYTVSDHDISPNLIDPDAVYVLTKLREAGYKAYLVGGSVRDLLLKRVPKDYDISTSALPEEIKDVFQRRCILIGRRFRLAHIRLGRKIIEVATFRSGEDEGDLIVHDNQWGNEEQDVLRRDFTINGLFYDPTTHEIIDYVGGWEDIHKNVLRTIGDAEIRFRQDPVRMIRLLKFRARFGFQLHVESKKALIKCREEIVKSSQARVLEEMLRMMESGASAPFFSLMMESGLLGLLFPALDTFLKGPKGKQSFLYFTGADKINQTLTKQKLDRSVLMACILYPMLEQEVEEKYLSQGNTPHLGEVIMSATAILKNFTHNSFSAFPRRITVMTHAIMSSQYRLTPSKQAYSNKVFRYKEFPLALSFLQIRALVNKELIEVYSHWKALFRQHLHQTEDKGHSHPPPYIRRRES